MPRLKPGDRVKLYSGCAKMIVKTVDRDIAITTWRDGAGHVQESAYLLLQLEKLPDQPHFDESNTVT